VAEAEGVAEAVGVGVAVGVTVGVGVGVVHAPSMIERLSMRHPGADVNMSVPIRQRSLMVWPFRLGPRFSTVVM
jgi:hypothetical protein